MGFFLAQILHFWTKIFNLVPKFFFPEGVFQSKFYTSKQKFFRQLFDSPKLVGPAPCRDDTGT